MFKFLILVTIFAVAMGYPRDIPKQRQSLNTVYNFGHGDDFGAIDAVYGHGGDSGYGSKPNYQLGGYGNGNYGGYDSPYGLYKEVF